MNFAHLHLILNHIPVVGIPVAISFLIFGLYTKNQATVRFAHLVLIALAAVVLPVYLTGEPAEEIVEHLPGVAESVIEAHEEGAFYALVLTLTTAAFAFLALFFQKNIKKARVLNFAVLTLAALAILNLLYTANLGGKIRHTELQQESSLTSPQDLNFETGQKKERDND